MAPTVAVLVVAAGRGVRAGGGMPKQYRPLAGRPLIRHSVTAFLGHPEVTTVRVVIASEDGGLYAESLGDLALPEPVTGGSTRQISVFTGLETLAANDPPDIVLIHDAARPFVGAELIARVIAVAGTDGGAIPATAVTDTLKRAAPGTDRIAGTVPRDGLFQAQTPQAFRFGDILAAHRAAAEAGIEATDDAALMEWIGRPVTLVAGDPEGMKVTESADFARAEARLTRMTEDRMEPRVGTGFDVHRFAVGDHVTLCGVRIAHHLGLAGHSDADVGLHALTDAILGAIGAGDIGLHFPPSDPRWRGADSAAFLRHAIALATRRGARLRHLDVTLICEAPKIGPHRAAMRARVAEIAGLSERRVSIKATTTEKLGFTGRKEGIAAQAVATLMVPDDD
ncbi:bifunctional 2-C-methyl-D-erythritol 4-phosphate cytidylyltransferase/2-C-methyl-D-erythritol 2,4-cyclodiphosphate synthase [Marivibrio halodurans]|uniref:Bifunctional enzyme IspD/IspF n=1 Tax=Marivibrio halodurans TaxID=2039722 RepID=A0A8J7V0R2_9PROT|nr:bifunctional 2-C-methyl-D-erythritol 4-phosphate cytidylyltransferase/2-C-methyl-D-erythritol 2,4-cyclodiphosphate synthase [Marivibrio halodurans]MBP5855570.1 bifunctional 2-C-methyl-D-erythritol 4-phosphate cytidylyltransferase/2-C-methyl-D-erythritol 2,4-cyclodiphosphate synthase [Marivibrio halodurans]